jgi:hypothetical protein
MPNGYDNTPTPPPDDIDEIENQARSKPILVWQEYSPGRYRRAETMEKAAAMAKKYAEEGDGPVYVYRRVAEVKKTIEIHIIMNEGDE